SIVGMQRVVDIALRHRVGCVRDENFQDFRTKTWLFGEDDSPVFIGSRGLHSLRDGFGDGLRRKELADREEGKQQHYITLERLWTALAPSRSPLNLAKTPPLRARHRRGNKSSRSFSTESRAA